MCRSHRGIPAGPGSHRRFGDEASVASPAWLLPAPVSSVTPASTSDALADEARRKGRTLDVHLVTVGEPCVLTDTRVTARCHFVCRSPTGEVLVRKLAKKLARQVVEDCIPPSRIADARAAGSTEDVLALQAEARELFTTLEHSGETGELLLYLLRERRRRVPALVREEIRRVTAPRGA